MNLEESNEFVKNQNSKNKKRNVILGLIVICIAVVVILFIMINVLKIKDANTAKLYVNGEKVNLSRTLFISQDNVTYVSAKELSAFAGYNYIQGEYKKYTQDENYCYLQSEYEVISIAVDSNKIKKYLINKSEEKQEKNASENKANQNTVPTFVVKSEDDAMEVFELSSNVISINGNIYVPIEKIEKIFNISMVVDGKTTRILNINALYRNAQIRATNLKYQEISGFYENIRAIPDDMIVVKDSSDKYGVISYVDGKKILDMKYTDIQYIQNTGEFFVYTENSVGLLDKNGKTIITPTKYDSLSVFDEFNKLYLAEENGKFGVLDVKGNVVVPVAYDKIGLKSIELFTDFELTESESPNLLESKYIVVLENGKFGLYDIEGNRLIKSIYNSFGFLPTQDDKKADLSSVLVIPKDYGVYGLVIEQNGLYGIFDLELSDIIIPCSLSKIYSKTDSGELSYYMETEEEVFNVIDFFLDYDNGVEEDVPQEPEEEDGVQPEEEEPTGENENLEEYEETSDLEEPENLEEEPIEEEYLEEVPEEHEDESSSGTSEEIIEEQPEEQLEEQSGEIEENN